MFGGDDPLWSKTSSQPQAPRTLQQQRKTNIDYKAIGVNKEKVRRWIYEQAVKFRESYTAVVAEMSGEKSGMNVLGRLQAVVGRLDLKSVTELEEIVGAEGGNGKADMLERLDKVNKEYMNALVEISKFLFLFIWVHSKSARLKIIDVNVLFWFYKIKMHCKIIA